MTGVQTCALPIYYAANHAYGGGAGHDNTNKSGYSKGYPFGQGEYGYYFGGILAVVENA